MSLSRNPSLEQLAQENQLLRRQRHDYEKLNNLLKTICSSLDVDEILQRIIEAALNLCEAQQGAIILFDPEEDRSAKTLIHKAGSQSVLPDHFLNTQLAGWVGKHKSILLSEQLSQIFGGRIFKVRYKQISSVLSVPLLLKSEILGAINLISLLGQKPLGEREAQLMSVLASQCVHFIKNARLHRQLFNETSRLKKQLREKFAYHGIIGNSPKMREVFTLIDRIIPTDGRVVIEGESGTGKELIARALHFNGPRKDATFVAVDCGALPPNLLESELFGYEKGAFTGALKDKKGLFEEAHRGTLFLDEIANIPLETQSKLLRAIHEREIRPVGGTRTRAIDVRLIVAASEELQAAVQGGTFREDLYYRLNVITVKLPPLRERTEDIPVLAQYFLDKFVEPYGKALQRVAPETLARMEDHHWPGNVRELENIVERAVILADENQKEITSDLLPWESVAVPCGPASESPADLSYQTIKNQKAFYEKQMLLEALQKRRWNQSATARDLGIHESTLRYKMQKLKIRRTGQT